MAHIEIPLTQGFVTIIDVEDAELVTKFKWNAQYNGTGVYAGRWIYAEKRPDGKWKKKRQWLHRLIMDAPEGLFVDHINGNPLDNRRSNLRLVNATQNAQNMNSNRSTASKYKGVYIYKSKPRKKPFYSRIQSPTGDKFLGYFSTEEEAARAYDAAATKFFGEYARLNFPEGTYDGKENSAGLADRRSCVHDDEPTMRPTS